MSRQEVEAIVAELNAISQPFIDQPVSPSFADGLKVQAVIDAALEAHQCNGWVPVAMTAAQPATHG